MKDSPIAAGRVTVAGDAGTDDPVPGESGPVLRVEELRTGFRSSAGTAWVVDDIDLQLEQGRTLGIVGESGSGKTMLARSIMGLLPRAGIERSGRVLFHGLRMDQLPPSELRRIWGTEMSMVFQDPMTSLNPVVRVGRQITEVLRVHRRMTRSAADDAAVELMRSVRIPEPERRAREYPHQLSGGMRQRIGIAIALVCSPRLLIADEPTTALDVTVQSQILDLLQQQQSARSMAMILVTHDLGVVAGRADDIAVMYAGQIVEQGPARSVFRSPRMPYTDALMRSIPRIHDPSHTRLAAIAGRPPDLLDRPPGCRFAPRCPSAQDRCRQDEPPLVDDVGSGHRYRCWFPLGTGVERAGPQGNVHDRVADRVPMPSAVI
ncbi:ABC transporter ATP-binding protein [Pseudonocardia sp.]|uniref:ABC transporter ATP-binding protein n=1 Tax=Pseudonocardia sp. TaxID=60912 RepID=UPI00261A3CDA|nr:ABC transporter ATP-binding protein [Pseudonocardia sp.]